MDKIEVTQADRLLVADMLDEVSNLLDHNGIGQVADLIRDGEYDEHDCVKIAANHRLATRTDATPVAWMPRESAPHACHVIGARLDVDAGEWIMQVVASPPIQPFTHWQPLPAAPDHSEEPRAMVPDVAALVEAAKAMDEDHMISEHHHPGYVLVPTVAFEQMRQALAPFTKGQNDG